MRAVEKGISQERKPVFGSKALAAAVLSCALSDFGWWTEWQSVQLTPRRSWALPSQVAWFAVAAPVVTVLLGHARGEVSPALRAQVAEHAAAFALSALESRAPTPEPVP